MIASLHKISAKEALYILVLFIVTLLLSLGHEYITLLPFVVVMGLILQLNRFGFLVGAVLGILLLYYSTSLPSAVLNIVFGCSCLLLATRDYVPKNLQGLGWVYFAGYVCYLTLGLLSFGMFMSLHDIPYYAADLQYLGAILVASALMANGLSTSWVLWIVVCILGLLNSWLFLPMLAVSLYGFFNWSRNL